MPGSVRTPGALLAPIARPCQWARWHSESRIDPLKRGKDEDASVVVLRRFVGWPPVSEARKIAPLYSPPLHLRRKISLVTWTMRAQTSVLALLTAVAGLLGTTRTVPGSWVGRPRRHAETHFLLFFFEGGAGFFFFFLSSPDESESESEDESESDESESDEDESDDESESEEDLCGRDAVSGRRCEAARGTTASS